MFINILKDIGADNFNDIQQMFVLCILNCPMMLACLFYVPNQSVDWPERAHIKSIQSNWGILVN